MTGGLDRVAFVAPRRMARAARAIAGHRIAGRAVRWVAAAGRRTGAVMPPVARAIAGRKARLAVALVVVAVGGVILGVLLAGRVGQDVGPFQAEFSVTPSLSGGTQIDIPPLGSVRLNSHTGPAKLTMRLGALDQRRAEAVVNDPNGLDKASNTAVEDLGRGVTRVALQTAGVSVLGAMLLGALVFRQMRRVAICGGLALATVAASGGIAVATFRPNAVEEPRYQGLLANAPAVVGDARRIANQYDEYKAELQRMVRNVGKLYGAVSSLPIYQPDVGTTRVLHVSDLHLNPAAWSVIETAVNQFGIDVVVDTGDINDWGTQMESSYVEAIKALNVPYVYVRGNHDSALTSRAVAAMPNAVVLDNRTVTVHGLTIAGIGDPRFTPDKTTESADPNSAHQALRGVYQSGEQLAATIRASGTPVDMALVHDPASAGALDGTCPLVLAGHLHHHETRVLPAAPGEQVTTVLVEGSTGGAGLRGLEGRQPVPLEMSVLYFGTDRRLKAYDAITVGGTGQAEVTLQRHVMPASDQAAAPSR